MTQEPNQGGNGKANKSSNVPSSSGSERSGIRRQRIKLDHSYT